MTSDGRRPYRVRCVGTHQTSGTVLGAGIGECSSNEEKYKWKRSNRREFDAAAEDRRRIHALEMTRTGSPLNWQIIAVTLIVAAMAATATWAMAVR